MAGGTEILQATDIRIAGRERPVRRLRGALGPVPARRLGGADTTAEALAKAQAIVAAFAATPGAGAVGIDGKMYDRPHLVRAQQMLAREGNERSG